MAMAAPSTRVTIATVLRTAMVEPSLSIVFITALPIVELAISPALPSGVFDAMKPIMSPIFSPRISVLLKLMT